MTREELLQALRTVVIEATGLPGEKVIEYQPPNKGARPALPYVAVHLLTTGRAVGRDAGTITDTVAADDEELVVDMVGERIATASFSAYGVTSYDLLEAVRRARFREGLKATQREQGIAIRTVSDVTDTTVQIDGTRFQKQATMTATIAYLVEYADAVGVVEDVVTTTEIA